VIGLLSLTTACGSGSHSPTVVARRAATSQVVLSAFVLQRSGVVFWIHPTEARITLTATSGARLNVCEIGTTFSHHWTGGCRHVGRRTLALPTSGGAVHIGFRVSPPANRPVRVSKLIVRWHCVDHFFALGRGSTRVPVPSPILDC
jgi:hypothetical protein